MHSIRRDIHCRRKQNVDKGRWQLEIPNSREIVPQGSVLGQHCFLYDYINDRSSTCIKLMHCKQVLHMTLLYQLITKTLTRLLQLSLSNELKRVKIKWCENNHMAINISKSRKRSYNAYILLAHFDCCCVIWGNCTSVMEDKLVKLQKRAARAISDALRNHVYST